MVPAGHLSITLDAEAARLVEALAMTLTDADPSKNHFTSIWVELERRFRVTSYANLSIHHYDDVIGWLNNWLAHLYSEAPD